MVSTHSGGGEVMIGGTFTAKADNPEVQAELDRVCAMLDGAFADCADARTLARVVGDLLKMHATLPNVAPFALAMIFGKALERLKVLK